MSLIKAFTDAFKKAATRNPAKEAIDSGQAGTLGSTTQSDAGAFTPLRPAPDPESTTPVPGSGFKVSDNMAPSDPEDVGEVRVKVEGVALGSSDPEEGGEVDYKASQGSPAAGDIVITKGMDKGSPTMSSEAGGPEPVPYPNAPADPLAHEAAHTVQQEASGAGTPIPMEQVSVAYSKVEGGDPAGGMGDYMDDDLPSGASSPVGGIAVASGDVNIDALKEPGKIEHPNVDLADAPGMEGQVNESDLDFLAQKAAGGQKYMEYKMEEAFISSVGPGDAGVIGEDGVAGDAGAAELASAARKAGAGQEEYFKVEMEEVLVSSARPAGADVGEKISLGNVKGESGEAKHKEEISIEGEDASASDFAYKPAYEQKADIGLKEAMEQKAAYDIKVAEEQKFEEYQKWAGEQKSAPPPEDDDLGSSTLADLTPSARVEQLQGSEGSFDASDLDLDSDPGDASELQ